MDIKTKLMASNEDRQKTLLYNMVCKDLKLVTAKKKKNKGMGDILNEFYILSNFSYSSHTVV